jgi:hypothetical protein
MLKDSEVSTGVSLEWSGEKSKEMAQLYRRDELSIFFYSRGNEQKERERDERTSS